MEAKHFLTMNSIDFTQQGGLWTYQDTLKFMQDTYTPLLNAITTGLGNNVIVSGCAITGASVAPGWLIYNGELLPLAQSALATNIDVQEADGSEQFNDGAQKSIYKVRKAILTNAAVGVPFSSFKQLKYLSAFLNLPTVAGADYAAVNDNVLATITALFNLKAELLPLTNLSGMVKEWGGALNKIPAGWLLCDGRSLAVADYPALYAALGNTWGGDAENFNIPNTLDKFTIGAGNSYGVGATGGEATHTLSVDEMPSHTHDYGDATGANASGTELADGGYDGGNTNFHLKTRTTASTGNGQAHNNMPPYVALPKIIKI